MNRSISAALLLILLLAPSLQGQTQPPSPPSTSARLTLVNRLDDGRNMFVETSTAISALPQVWLMTAFPAPEVAGGTAIVGTWALLSVDCANRTLVAVGTSTIRPDGSPTPPQVIQGERMSAWDGIANPEVYVAACTGGSPDGVRFAGVMSAIKATQRPPGPPPSGSVNLAYLGGGDDGDVWFADLRSMKAGEHVWILTGYLTDRNVNAQSWSGHWTQVGIDCNTQAATTKGFAGVTSSGETLAPGNQLAIATVETISAGEDIFDVVCLARLPDARPAGSAQLAISAHREAIR